MRAFAKGTGPQRKYISFRAGAEKSCDKKIAYDEESAHHAAFAMSQQYGIRFVVYKCYWCGWWHVGSDKE